MRNRARLVAKGYSQEEHIYFDETYALVARLEVVRLLVAYTCFIKEVYVEQPSSFEGINLSNHVFKFSKVLYGFKQAPCTWYERLSSFLVEKYFTKGKVDTTSFIKKSDAELLIVQI